MKNLLSIKRQRPTGIFLSVALLLTIFATAATAAEAAAIGQHPGFWAGMADGFLALLKLLVSPFAPVSIVDPAAAGWHYDAGYYIGVLSFAAVAGAAASAPASEPADVARPVGARALSAHRGPVR